jgi:hypothetical protein
LRLLLLFFTAAVLDEMGGLPLLGRRVKSGDLLPNGVRDVYLLGGDGLRWWLLLLASSG